MSAPPAAASRTRTPSRVATPTAISPRAIIPPRMLACSATALNSGPSGLVSRTAAIWAWIEFGAAGSKKLRSASLSSPA